MTLAEEWRAEGMAIGEAKGETKILLMLLKQKFGTLSATALETIRKANTEQLEGWTAKVLGATTLEDVFAH